MTLAEEWEVDTIQRELTRWGHDLEEDWEREIEEVHGGMEEDFISFGFSLNGIDFRIFRSGSKDGLILRYCFNDGGR